MMTNTAPKTVFTAADDASDPSVTLTGKTVLLVEDNLFVAAATQDMFRDLGAIDVLVANSVESALETLGSGEVGLAMLDIQLGQGTSQAVAEACKDADVPFVLTTGYGPDDGALAPFPAAPVCTKPYDTARLARALSELTACASNPAGGGAVHPHRTDRY
ncbi:MAG: hypothetical protein ACU0GG_13520 [Paracoccaceae bacterium]